MLGKRGFFGFGGWKQRNVHSIDHLKYLYSVLSKNPVVTESNKSVLVETLRSIAEILIWGDQNDSSVFDFFLERNMLSFFLKIMNQRCGSYVCVQLLQTLNILFENIRNETSIYYLLSNNHVNAIIGHKFDFSDEEVMAYYISFLKTLSFRLNKHTIHFFYNEHTNDFPLYTEAIKLFNHGESMVRIAVRTLTLNVYRVQDDSMLKFVIDKTATAYFANLVWFVGNHVLDIDSCVKSDTAKIIIRKGVFSDVHRNLNRLKDLVAEHLDHLHYINDILSLNISDLNAVLSDHLLNRLFLPLYVYSLTKGSRANHQTKTSGSSSLLADLKPHVGQVTALFLLCQVFLIIHHKPLVRMLAWLLLNGDQEVFADAGVANAAASVNALCNKEEDEKVVTGSLLTPRFVAPSQTLEKSLRDQLRSKKSVGSRRIKKRESSERTATNDDEAPNNCEDSKKVEDKSDLHCLSITDEEKEKRLQSHTNNEKVRREAFTTEDKPFSEALFNALEAKDNDYLTLFALGLIHAMQENKGMCESILATAFIPWSGMENKSLYNRILMDKLLVILASACQYGSRIRLVTLDLCLMVLRSCCLVANEGNNTSFLEDEHYAEIEDCKEESTLILRNFYKSEEIFLDMFEDEYSSIMYPTISNRLEYTLSDASLLLPPTPTPLTGIDFTRRLPCGEVERARRSIRVFFKLRQLSLDVQSMQETMLPLYCPDNCIQVQDILDLNNSDLLAVMVEMSPSGNVKSSSGSTPSHTNSSSGSKQRRFLVVDVYQIVLVEPDSNRLGWGVARFVGFLQDLEVLTDKDDSRCLHVTVQSPGASSNGRSKAGPKMAATFTFDDHIRCMAAKQRLIKGRVKARQRKMHQIARLLDLPGNVAPTCPSPPTAINLHSLRHTDVQHRRGRRSSSNSDNSYRPIFSAAQGRVPGAAAQLVSAKRPTATATSTAAAETTATMMSDSRELVEQGEPELAVEVRENETTF